MIDSETEKLPMQWYVLHTYSGYEKKVAGQLKERLRQEGMAEFLGEVLVPEEDVVEIKSGKKRISARKFFPGYIMIEMSMNEKVWFVVKETPRITGFLGDANEPTPLKPEEVERIKDQLTGASEKPKPKYTFDVGESIRVNDGPFANFTGVLDEVNMERAKVKVMISVFGRATPVELEFSQIEKI
ncbi:Transcription antitermination protein NusG [hydrothermal vent metagenome]|uniref:Transcription antitermination protein NusG n=1 Tax=hydrothermal vent metagenome TaxID=652676 RepID=A0A3B1BYS5_9ZZZZ